MEYKLNVMNTRYFGEFGSKIDWVYRGLLAQEAKTWRRILERMNI